MGVAVGTHNTKYQQAAALGIGLRGWLLLQPAICVDLRRGPPETENPKEKKPGPDKSWYPPQDLPNTGRSSRHHYTLNRATTRMQATHC